MEGSTILTDDQTGESTSRSDLNLSATRFRRNRWFNTTLAGLETNDDGIVTSLEWTY